MANKEPKDYTLYGVLILLAFFYVIVPVFLNTNNTQVNQTSNNEMKFDSLTFTSMSFDVELSIDDIDTVFDEVGNELLKVVFRTNLNNQIECEIPASYAEQIDKDFKYKGHMFIISANEYYEELNRMVEETYGTKVENELEFIQKNPSGYRVTNIHFMFSDYITDGIFETNQESEDDLKKIFLADSQVGSNDDGAEQEQTENN